MTIRFSPLLLLVLLVTPPVHAQVLSYNGDPSYVNGYMSMYHPGRTVFAYDNFQVAGTPWTVTGFFGTFIAVKRIGLHPAPTSSFWEIRTGMFNGVAGTLLYSGESFLTWTHIGAFNTEFLTDFRAEVTGFIPFSLPVGTYWLTLAPNVAHIPLVTEALAGVWWTDGANAINPLLDHQALVHFPPNNIYRDVGRDLSYGVIGEAASVVPEPSTIVLLGTGLGILALRALRRRRLPSITSDENAGG